jgi:dolichol-phosphate mannosyltransferase
LAEASIDKLNLLIVSPVFNESSGISEFISTIAALKKTLSAEYDLRMLLVDDGSTDNTPQIMQRHLQEYDWITVKTLLGNFGHQAALVAGLEAVDEWPHVIVTMDSDLEHPPDAIPEMLKLYKKSPNCLLVQGLREPLADLNWRKRLCSKLFYRIVSVLTGLKLNDGQCDFCLWNAGLMRSMKPYLNSIGSLRVFAAWIPGLKSYLPFKQNLRKKDSSKYTLRQNWNLMLNSVVRFSSMPLRLITWLGFIGVGISLLHLMQIAVAIYRNEPLQPGWTTLIVTIIFMGCLQLICLGVLASYLRRLVFGKDLPLFLGKETKENLKF